MSANALTHVQYLSCHADRACISVSLFSVAIGPSARARARARSAARGARIAGRGAYCDAACCLPRQRRGPCRALDARGTFPGEDSFVPAINLVVAHHARAIWTRLGSFDELDLNRDGIIDESEVAAAFERRHGRASHAQAHVCARHGWAAD